MTTNNKEKEMNNINYAIRHGEVLLFPVSELPKGEVSQHDKFIVGHSETGHHHILESKTEFEVTTDTVDKAMLYIRLFEPATLVHQKSVNRHKDLKVPAGTYKIIHKTEYDPFQKIRRAVWD